MARDTWTKSEVWHVILERMKTDLYFDMCMHTWIRKWPIAAKVFMRAYGNAWMHIYHSHVLPSACQNSWLSQGYVYTHTHTHTHTHKDTCTHTHTHTHTYAYPFFVVTGLRGGVPGRDACMPEKAYFDFFSAGLRIYLEHYVRNLHYRYWDENIHRGVWTCVCVLVHKATRVW
jgi:hypothetical protein